MTVGELREVLMGLPDQLPIVGWDVDGNEPTEEVEFHRGNVRFSNGVEFAHALRVHVGNH